MSINVGNLFHKGSNGQNSTHGETHRPLDFALFKRYVAEDKRRIKTPGENPTLSASPQFPQQKPGPRRNTSYASLRLLAPSRSACDPVPTHLSTSDLLCCRWVRDAPISRSFNFLRGEVCREVRQTNPESRKTRWTFWLAMIGPETFVGCRH